MPLRLRAVIPLGRGPVGRRRDRPPHERASFRIWLLGPVDQPRWRERKPLHKRRTGLQWRAALTSVAWKPLGFWARPQHPLDGARMQTHSEASLDAVGKVAKTSRRFVRAHLLQE